MKHNTYNYEGGQPFKVEAPFTPTGDQPTAIQSLTEGIERGEWAQVLLGATGTGKTFTMAKVIEAVQKPTLIIAHNKTLAAQLCSEFKSFFPNNAVEYFVSYYDFYQPEAYIPSSDTYIEKDASINDEIDKLRHSATMSLFERRDVIIVASVSCIYGLGDPEDYSELVLSLRLGQTKSRDEILSKLVDIQYTRNDMNFIRGTFRVQGDTIEIFPAAYSERAIRVELFGDEIDRLVEVDALTGEVIAERKHVAVYPASHYVTTKDKMRIAVERIEAELEEQLAKLKAADRLLEAQRLEQRTRYDIEMMQEMGYCSGIENYSRHMSERKAGEAVSATPGPYEMEVETNIAEQIIRPTGLLDPSIEIRPIKGQMDDLLGEIHKRAAKNERVLVTTLTKKMAEDLTEFLKEMGIRVRYLHSDIVTIERAEIVRDLRAGVFDVLVGINLLREGLDMPEVSLVAILDADKEGFLRSDTAMIQTIGRAARNVNGHVIMYADRVTGSMQRAIDETDRRRAVQEAYNIEHNITPKSVSKDVKELIELTKIEEDMVTDGKDFSPKKGKKKSSTTGMDHGHELYAQEASTPKVADITPEELFNKIEELDRQMKAAAKQLEFEKAAKLRDQLGELRQQWSDMHSAGESKLKKPASSKGRKRTSTKSKS